MIPLEIEGAGWGRYTEPFEIDLRGAPEGPIALSGIEGSGKSLLLEMLYAVPAYLEFPSRRPKAAIPDSCPSGAGFFKTTFGVDDRTYRSSVVVKNGKFDPRLDELQGAAWEALVAGSNCKGRYLDQMEKMLGPKDVSYATVFSMQDGDVFGQMRSDSKSSGELRRNLFRHYLDLGRYERMAKVVGDRLKAIDTAQADRLAKRIESAQADLDAAQSGVAGAERTATEKRREVEKAQAALAEAERGEEARTARTQAEADLQAAQKRLGSAKSALDAACTRLAQTRAAAEAQVPAAGADPDEIAQKREEDTEVRRTLAAAQAALAEVKARADRAGSDLERSKRTVEMISTVPFGDKCAEAECRFLTDAVAAKKRLPTLSRVAEESTGALAACQATKDSLPLPLPEAEARRLQADEQAARRAIQARRDAETRRESALDRLAIEEAAIEFHEEALVEARAEVARLAERLEALPEVSGKPAHHFRWEVQQCQKDLQKADDAVVAARALVRALEMTIEESQRDLDAMQTVLADVEPLRLLHRSLGPTGIQAHEIAAAGPRVSEIINDLLTACYSGRFLVDLGTQRQNKDGTFREVAPELIIVDTETGQELDFSQPSGGERTPIAEALKIGQVLFKHEKTGIQHRTLFRDEPTGNLSPSSAIRYVDMLARACSIGGFRNVYFVTHSEAAVRAAAGAIYAEDGRYRLSWEG